MASIEKDRYDGQSFNQLLGIKVFSLVGFPEANLLFLFCIQGFIKKNVFLEQIQGNVY